MEEVISALRLLNIPIPTSACGIIPSSSVAECASGWLEHSCPAIRLLIADEPTTALDATIQAQYIDLFKGAAQDKCSILFITHDFGVVSQMCHGWRLCMPEKSWKLPRLR